MGLTVEMFNLVQNVAPEDWVLPSEKEKADEAGSDGDNEGEGSSKKDADAKKLKSKRAKLQAAAEREGRRFLDDLDTMHMIWGIAAGMPSEPRSSRWRQSGSIG